MIHSRILKIFFVIVTVMVVTSMSAQDLDAEYEPDVPPPVEEEQEEPKLSPKDPEQQIKELDNLCEQLKELKEYLENKQK